MRWNLFSSANRSVASKEKRTRSSWRPRLEALEDRTVPASIFVTNGSDDGAGSLRAALGQANSDSTIDSIIIKHQVGTVSLLSSLHYTGAQHLSIVGHGTSIRPTIGSEGTFDLLESTGGADLAFEKLTFRNGLKGIEVILPAGAIGDLSVSLKQVTIQDNIQHGLHINDITHGTASGVWLDVQNSVIIGNGSDPADFDGIRVDDTAGGGIVASFLNSTVVDNGGDGIELDERSDGSVIVDIRNSSINHNGNANAADLEDGFDIDEGGAGNIVATVVNTQFNDNFEGGFDVNEDDGSDPTDAGNLVVRLTNVQGNDNDDKGLDFNEGDGGEMVAGFFNVEASYNGIFAGNLEEGIVMEEAGGGSIITAFHNVTANGNGDDGIDIDETGDGDFVGFFANVTANDNGAEGIDIDEADAGAFFITLLNITSNDPLDVTD